jgi:hypothetical protein
MATNSLSIWNPKAQYHVRRNPLSAFILYHMNPVFISLWSVSILSHYLFLGNWMFSLTLCTPNIPQTVSSITHSINTSTPVSSVAGRARLAASVCGDVFIRMGMNRFVRTLWIQVAFLNGRLSIEECNLLRYRCGLRGTQGWVQFAQQTVARRHTILAHLVKDAGKCS